MKYLVTGVKGQLGFDIVRELKSRGNSDIVALDVEEMDITDKNQVEKIISLEKPDVIFHCAAWTAVDKAEDEGLKDTVYKVNVEGTKNIVESAKEVNAKLFYISTDYVFDGAKEGLYEVDDMTSPKCVYGMTKYQGEEMVCQYDNSFIVRISWVFGINGNNFIKTMLRLAQEKTELNVVADQIGSPTYTVDLARLLVDMSKTQKFGTYHATNEGFCSWAELAEYVFAINNLNVLVNHIPTSQYPTAAKRPMNSKMSKNSLTDAGFDLLPPWQDAVDRYILELKK